MAEPYERRRSFDEEDWNRPVMGSGARDTVLERRSLVWNDNGVVAPVAPPANYTEVILKGKFYTRGCRGMIEQLQIYCIRTAAGVLQLRYSPHPCLGPINTVTITPAATWGWVAVDIEEMWNYDSLFIWVYTCDADVSWAYDAVQPFDGHWSQDAGATWEDMAIRPFIRAVYTGETPGDVPVSGIINNVPIPYYSTSSEEKFTGIELGVETLIVEVEGAGYCDFIHFSATIGAEAQHSTIVIYCDDVEVFTMSFATLEYYQFLTGTPALTLGRYLVDGFCVMMINKRWEFRRRFSIYAINPIGPAQVTVRMYPTLMR